MFALVAATVHRTVAIGLFESCSLSEKEKTTRSGGLPFSGCGGRTRTYDLRVMSPTSFQLLYSAILAPQRLYIIPWRELFVNPLFERTLRHFSPCSAKKPHRWKIRCGGAYDRSCENPGMVYIKFLMVEIRISPATTRSSAAKPVSKLSE